MGVELVPNIPLEFLLKVSLDVSRICGTMERYEDLGIPYYAIDVAILLRCGLDLPPSVCMMKN